MSDIPKPSLIDQFSQFDVPGEILSVSEISSGHLHKTYLGTWSVGGGISRFVHQQINTNVFPDVPSLMTNTERILAHVKRCVEEEKSGEPTIELIGTRSGSLWSEAQDGECYRTFTFVENGQVYRRCPDLHIAREAGRLSGRFLRRLRTAELDLAETIPNFVFLHRRFEHLQQAIEGDAHNRLSSCEGLHEKILSQASSAIAIGEAIEGQTLPPWNCHNDPKLENMLFRSETGEGLCLVDLDTAMKSSVVYDFGDLLRSGAVLAQEDEQDVSSIQVNEPYLNELTRGLLDELQESLSNSERGYMVQGPGALALTLSARFLADYLNGDVYFGVERPLHNLERARAQFRVYQAFQEKCPELEKLLLV